jgi:tRNA-(ms[2]io[6]A)-hydroxylase
MGPLDLRVETAPEWLDLALANMDKILLDHANCEKKAAATAMSLVSAYPNYPELVRRCTRLALEELRHFEQVYSIIQARGLTLTRDRGESYAKKLVKSARDPEQERLVDRLLIAGIIEARSHERLALLSTGLEDPELASFYKALATAEAGHARLFVGLAERCVEGHDVLGRLDELLDREGEILSQLPVEPRVH